MPGWERRSRKIGVSGINPPPICARLERIRRDRTSRTTTASVGPRGSAVARSRPILIASIVLLLAIGGVTAWWLANRVDTTPIDSVAVLPFENVGGDPATEYLSDGLTDRLINALAQVRDLRVVPRSTMFRYKGQTADPEEIARALGVRAVLSGSLTQRGDALIVDARLMDVQRQSQLWGDTYDRKMNDLGTIQAQSSREIFESLRLRLSGDEANRLVAPGTRNTEALNLVFRGLYHRQKVTEESLRASIATFSRRSIWIPSFPWHTSASRIPTDRSGICSSARRVRSGRARGRRPRRPLKLDPSSAEAHAALGHAILRYDWNPAAAKAELERALELNPRYAIGHHWYAHYLLAHAPGPEILAESRRAVELEPGDLMLNAHLFYMHSAASQADRLEQYVNAAQQIDPNFWAVHTALGMLHGHRKEFDAALREYELGVELSGQMPLALQSLALFHVTAGRPAEAEAIVARLQQRPYPPPYHLATIYRRLGDADKMGEWLERGLRERDGAMIDVNSWPESWRSHPKVQDVLRRMTAR